MNNYSKIYWLTRLDSLQAVFATLLILSVALIVVFLIIRLIDPDNDVEFSEISKKHKFTVLLIFFIGVIGTVFIPTKNEMLLIIAGGETLNYIEKDTLLQKTPQQATKIISKYLDNKLKGWEFHNESSK